MVWKSALHNKTTHICSREGGPTRHAILWRASKEQVSKAPCTFFQIFRNICSICRQPSAALADMLGKMTGLWPLLRSVQKREFCPVQCPQSHPRHRESQSQVRRDCDNKDGVGNHEKRMNWTAEIEVNREGFLARRTEGRDAMDRGNK